MEKTLNLIGEIDTNVRVAIARELTKIHEEIVRGSLQEVQNKVRQKPSKGEFIILIEPTNSTGPKIRE